MKTGIDGLEIPHLFEDFTTKFAATHCYEEFDWSSIDSELILTTSELTILQD